MLCRNVLIYFDVDTKKNILGGIRSSLAEQACLLLGCAESTFNLDSGFVKKSVGQRPFIKSPSDGVSS